MRLRVGRVVNYGTNGEMVPSGKTALCLEYFASEDDPIAKFSTEQLLKLALAEAKENNLIDETKLSDQFVIRMPSVNAATIVTNWRTPWMKNALSYIANIEGLLETNRPGIDQAVLAGIHAAEACLTGNPMSTASLEGPPDS